MSLKFSPLPVFVSLLSGALFGVGLLISKMALPSKVLGFLNVAGIANETWDPSLGLVMVGAIAVHAVLHRLVTLRGFKTTAGGMSQTILNQPVMKQIVSHVDARLVIGATLFGVGWGTSGFCPGPALLGALNSLHTLYFCGAMTLGMLLHSVWAKVFFKKSLTKQAETNECG